ncbi:MAG: hypothetical protein ACE5H9_15880, partial [Anaerolineae bacterium]
MRRAVGIVASLILLAVAARGAALGTAALLDSAGAYRSPLNDAPIPATAAGDPLVERVALVVVHGLSAEAVQDLPLPTLERLIDAGASAPLLSPVRGGPVMAWATMLSGAEPGFNDASPFYQELGQGRPLRVDNLFAAAQDRGRGIGLAGQPGWERLFPGEYFRTSEEAETDAAVIVGAALSMLRNDDLQLVLVELSQVEQAIRRHGLASPEVDAAARQVDENLDLIARRVDLDRAALIVVLETGSFASRSELYVMAGRGVIPGRYSGIRPTDIAPTAAALLGTRLPFAAQGRPLLEMLRLDEARQAQFSLDLAGQQFERTRAYFAAAGLAKPLTRQQQDLATAQASFEKGNTSGASRLAELLVEDLGRQISLAQAARHAQERPARAAQAGAGLILVLAFLWWQRQPGWQAGLAAAALAVGIAHGLYRFQNGNYTLGLIRDLPAFIEETRWQVAAAMIAGAGLLSLILIFQRRLDFWQGVAAGFTFSCLAALGLAVPAIFAYWQTGWRITWYLPGGGPLFWHLSSLLQTSTAAMWGLALPWFTGAMLLGLQTL